MIFVYSIAFLKALFDKGPFAADSIQRVYTIRRKINFHFDIGLYIIRQKCIVVNQLFDPCGITVIFVLKTETLGSVQTNLMAVKKRSCRTVVSTN